MLVRHARARSHDPNELYLDKILDQRGMSSVTFDIRVVAGIPVNPRSRKFQLIVEARPAG